MNPGPGYPGPGYPPTNYPAPGYPQPAMPGPYGYAQPPYQGKKLFFAVIVLFCYNAV